MPYAHTIGSVRYTFLTLADLLAKATPERSGDALAGIAATSSQQRIAAQLTLAGLPLTTFLNEAVIPYESDEVTRLMVDPPPPAARKNSLVSPFPTTGGLPGRLSPRLQPNPPTDDVSGIAASIIDGLLLGS